MTYLKPKKLNPSKAWSVQRVQEDYSTLVINHTNTFKPSEFNHYISTYHNIEYKYFPSCLTFLDVGWQNVEIARKTGLSNIEVINYFRHKNQTKNNVGV